MSVLWRYRFTMPVLLFFISCDAQSYNEPPDGKFVYARGNHWAVGHLMGKKSLDDQLNSHERESNKKGYETGAEPDGDAPSSSLLRELIMALSGPGRDRRQQTVELERFWDEHLARESKISQALNTRDLDAS